MKLVTLPFKTTQLSKLPSLKKSFIHRTRLDVDFIDRIFHIASTDQRMFQRIEQWFKALDADEQDEIVNEMEQLVAFYDDSGVES